MRFFKKLTVPVTNETHQIDAVQMWEVRWMSRHGKWHSDLRPEMEAFTSEEQAKQFALSLMAAFKLVRNTSQEDTKIQVKKADNI